ncbi:hypothetical protein BO99DRAFT_8736 [Aspergillus violaceofuscus CBS 115571]|uniref:Secreted protein n=1 Tax=Aspergillus violaceofuscus (strain CBS 115571) TaxID=1450538 RepID=A0A2V5I201_ASPV1|nr:hypothetical protein BO99DRAFT_8736 [Aspergillus violaceofuscus CBS 115571]
MTPVISVLYVLVVSWIRTALSRSGHARAHTRDGRAVRPTDIALMTSRARSLAGQPWITSITSLALNDRYGQGKGKEKATIVECVCLPAALRIVVTRVVRRKGSRQGPSYPQWPLLSAAVANVRHFLSSGKHPYHRRSSCPARCEH